MDEPKLIGFRLKNERKRLNLSQEEFGLIGGVKKLAQANYESGKRCPDAIYLASVSRAGVDINYIISGVYSSSALSEEDRTMLAGYRALDERTRNRINAFMNVEN